MDFYPALKYRFLTPFYDGIIRILVPEKLVKEKAINLCKLEKSDKVLDFGCGTGVLLQMLIRKEPGTLTFGIDPDPRMIFMAERRLGERSRLQVLDSEVLPFAAHTFDVILSTWVFHHLKNEEKKHYLQELKRILKSDGRLVIADWGKPSGAFQQLFSWLTRSFDNFETFDIHVKGEFPVYLTNAGFDLTNYGEKKTVLGTVKLWSLRNR